MKKPWSAVSHVGNAAGYLRIGLFVFEPFEKTNRCTVHGVGAVAGWNIKINHVLIPLRVGHELLPHHAHEGDGPKHQTCHHAEDNYPVVQSEGQKPLVYLIHGFLVLRLYFLFSESLGLQEPVAVERGYHIGEKPRGQEGDGDHRGHGTQILSGDVGSHGQRHKCQDRGQR